MNETATNYLRYVRASLADAMRLMPDLSDRNVELSFDEIEQGRFGQHATKQLFEIAKKMAGRQLSDEERLWPIKLIVCPRVYALRPDHGTPNQRLPAKVVPVFVCACLNKDGSLSLDENNRIPVIPRDYLEPTRHDVAIGSVDEADTAYATLSEAPNTWTEVISSAYELVQKVTTSPLDELRIEQYARLPRGLAVRQQRDAPTSNILRLVDLILDDASSRLLYEALVCHAPDRELKTAAELLDASHLHLGQMESRYGLSPSQRESLLHFLSEEPYATSVLAVDGPPGTGKTTLLLSAIATLWVKHALEELEAPLIIASSTNNQAVLNILEAFAKVEEKSGPLAGRWLSGIESYGLYRPAKGRQELGDESKFPVHTMRGMGKQAIYDAQKFETPEGFPTAKAEFFRSYETAFEPEPEKSLKQAAQNLRERIQLVTDSVATAGHNLQILSQVIPLENIANSAIDSVHNEFAEKKQDAKTQLNAASAYYRNSQELRLRWKKHLSDEPWWIGLLAFFGFRTPRINRDGVFCAEAEIEYTSLIGNGLRTTCTRDEIGLTIDALIDNRYVQERKVEALYKAVERDLEKFAKATEALRRLDLGQDGLTVASVQAALDVGPRFEAFKLATHYWEARYLAEVEEHLQRAATLDDAKSPKKLERQYRRLAKLFPCFVSTLFTLPNHFIGWNQEDMPLFETIDLLIIDEAGQVPPEAGVPSFALAKRALVVGDIDQIPPIWSIPHTIDGSNAIRHRVIADSSKLEEFIDSGMSASKGSLMRVAQRATPYAKHPPRGRGMFLSEHRRCWPEIIRICNTLIYQGLLKPCREEKPRKLLPTVGYVHIPGLDHREGKSRKNLIEATAIAKWLAQRKTEIETAFSEDGEPFNQLVAVITPFNAQTRAVRAALDSEFSSQHDITVGTVHSLQGAEWRVVIFSSTYGIDTAPGSTFFDRDRSILNVAISRAQDAFLIFGNMHLFQPTGSHPSAVVGRFLFQGGENELKDVPAQLLVPGYDMAPGQLIRDLTGHREVLAEAFSTAKSRLVIVSPFLTKRAIAADQIIEKIQNTTTKNVRVSVVSDPSLNTKEKWQFDECVDSLRRAGASVQLVQSQGVHSKMVLVDNSWFVVGSFNWLSAVRDPTHPYSRYESSIRYDGNESFQMISKTLRDLRDLLV